MSDQQRKLSSAAIDSGGSGKQPDQQVLPTAQSVGQCPGCQETVTPGVKGSMIPNCCNAVFHTECYSKCLLATGKCAHCRYAPPVPAAADDASGDDEPCLVCMAPGCGAPQHDGCLAVCDWPDCPNAICKVGCTHKEIPESAVLEGPGRRFLLCPGHAPHASRLPNALVFRPIANQQRVNTASTRTARYQKRDQKAGPSRAAAKSPIKKVRPRSKHRPPSPLAAPPPLAPLATT